MTRKVYLAQKESPVKGDFHKLVTKDLEILKIEDDLTNISKRALKRKVKESVKSVAFKYLNEKRETHTKVKGITYRKFQTQKYLKSCLFSNDEVSMLFTLRTKYMNCKMNFKYQYKEDELLCPLCANHQDTQENFLVCEKLKESFQSNEICLQEVKYDDIFSKDLKKQKCITNVYMKLVELREKLLDTNMDSRTHSTSILECAEDSGNSIV